MKSKELYVHLNNHYIQREKYCVSNVYCFHPFYCETDFLIVKKNGYIYDLELKVSRADYLVDKKKIHKHSILKNGYFQVDYRYSGKHEPNTPIYTNDRPHKFFYACPEGLIKESELESHQGLIYVLESGEIKIIKQAKFLHKEKIDIEQKLCNKFYYSYCIYYYF